MSFETDFENHLKEFSSAPYLFIGSGLSSRYINTEGWSGLLSSICEELKLPHNFHYYNSKSGNDLTKVASLMAEDLFELWWNDDSFKDSREKFQEKITDKEGPLKYEICKYFEKKIYDINESLVEEYRLFKKVNVEGIITTNWDVLLEKTFKDFFVYIGQDSLIFNNSIDVGEIYKIHGCVTDPNSLVLTNSDYQHFHDKNPYLAAKLLTIFMEHPIIFLGYNIGDENVHAILSSIIKILDKNSINKLKDRLIFCERDSQNDTPQISDGNYLINGLNLPIKKIKYNSLSSIYKVLANNNRKLPIKILRHMKSMVFDFVKNSKSKSKVYLADDSNFENLDLEKVQFVYGFGIKENLSMMGIKGVSGRDLLLDVVYNNLQIDPLQLSKNAIPEISGFIPYFKYLRGANLLDQEGNIVNNDQTEMFTPAHIEKVNSITNENFHPVRNYLLKKEAINEKYNSVKELVEGESMEHSIIYIPLLDIEKISSAELHNFILTVKPKAENLKTQLRKLICLYDFIKYKLNK